ncbi:8-oxo-dGTP pyrophosphatase MutT (NUDIX family) [Kitasatospora sp. GP30]|uniref:NUDIX hydrolase n=1 Tax=Kitasatospora acidiphila TaxID=2567942 RepID=A0A540W3C4_9ACTN|nr:MULTISPECIES: NUDIX hydrolase [Kitasatospora]MDH6141704.1 8-oxo-dGTP pyrophosphatase MutT (NUDIX family) [Kitasatospora sp. GP30]TQF03531.1 NUDIX hydrolase [Kitasatospora acidiphila]
MTHADAVRVLDAWAPADAAQEGLRRDYLAHLAAHQDGLYKSCLPAHITASALVVDPAAGRVLLTLHPKVGLWLQMGGHCEPADATLGAAALREATEESGIAGLALLSADGTPGGRPVPVQLDRHEVHCTGKDRPANTHLDVQYLALAPAGARELISEESLDLRWFGWDELPELTDDSVRRLVGLARELIG